MIETAINNRQSLLEITPERFTTAVQNVLHEANIRQASISIAVVDNPTIHRLNRQYLQHDYPTDVLSFLLDSGSLDSGDATLEGEIIVSAETAVAQAQNYGWSPQDELLLYVIHGALHLVGFDDQQPQDRERMEKAQQRQLAHFGLCPPEFMKNASKEELPDTGPEKGPKTGIESGTETGIANSPCELRKGETIRGD